MKSQPTVHSITSPGHEVGWRRWFLAMVMVAPALVTIADEGRVMVQDETRAKLQELSQASEPVGAIVIDFEARDARFVRLVIHRSSGGQACLDELEIFGPASDQNLALG